MGEQKITPADTWYSHMICLDSAGIVISIAYWPDRAGGVAKKYGDLQVKGSNAALWALLTFHLH